MQKVVVVMPAWNEGENLQRMIEALVDKEFPKIDAEMHILIVDNHSKDSTEEIRFRLGLCTRVSICN
jgi:glycosyltransferase involved in cell wall biosynthesis